MVIPPLPGLIIFRRGPAPDQGRFEPFCRRNCCHLISLQKYSFVLVPAVFIGLPVENALIFCSSNDFSAFEINNSLIPSGAVHALFLFFPNRCSWIFRWHMPWRIALHSGTLPESNGKSAHLLLFRINPGNKVFALPLRDYVPGIRNNVLVSAALFLAMFCHGNMKNRRSACPKYKKIHKLL